MDGLFIFFQKVAPQQLLSRLAGRLANSRIAWWKNTFIRFFIRKYGVDMSEAEQENPEDFTNFNDFFTRNLKADARPVCKQKNELACPADGAISQLGDIEESRIFQAKGHDFSLQALLGGDNELTQKFIGGKFSTIYLSPRDYHRVHCPLDGRLVEMLHIPGKLFSVNTVTAENIPALFARNERMVAIFDTEIGPMAVIMVGAMIVASIETVWAGLLPAGRKNIAHYSYIKNDDIRLEKGAELGRFKLGSTAILLFPKNSIEWNPTLKAGSPVRMGENIATVSALQ